MQIPQKLEKALESALNDAESKQDMVQAIRLWLHKNASLVSEQPVDMIQWVDVDKVCPNDYNPNSVASKEMHLLRTSIWNDGYTQPVVTIYDKNVDKYVIIDGFHRYFTCKNDKAIRERNNGLLPIVVLNKDINDRMASTVRHTGRAVSIV